MDGEDQTCPPVSKTHLTAGLAGGAIGLAAVWRASWRNIGQCGSRSFFIPGPTKRGSPAGAVATGAVGPSCSGPQAVARAIESAASRIGRRGCMYEIFVVPRPRDVHGLHGIARGVAPCRCPRRPLPVQVRTLP